MIRAAAILVLVLASGWAHAADSFGRLFFTPEQRAALDRSRRAPPPPERVPEAKPEPPAPVELPPERVTVNGMVRRSDGGTALWVNGRAMRAPELSGGVRVGNPDGSGRVTVALPEGKSVQLKVGQTVESAQGTVEETYKLKRPVPQAIPAAEAPAPRPVRRPRPKADEPADPPPAADPATDARR